jgi:urease
MGQADIGIKDGQIVAIGKAGNPDVMNITESMIIGSATEIITGTNKIVTAGAIDSQSNSICPHQVHEALASGVTTLICGGVGPSTGTISTSCPSGQFYIPSMLRAVDKLPLNFGIIANGSDSSEEELRNQVQLGAIGLGIHESWGSPPSVLDRCLK